MCLPTTGLMYIVRTTSTTSAIRKTIPTFRVRRIIVIMIPKTKSVLTSPKVVSTTIKLSTEASPCNVLKYLLTALSIAKVAPEATTAVKLANAPTRTTKEIDLVLIIHGGLIAADNSNEQS